MMSCSAARIFAEGGVKAWLWKFKVSVIHGKFDLYRKLSKFGIDIRLVVANMVVYKKVNTTNVIESDHCYGDAWGSRVKIWDKKQRLFGPIEIYIPIFIGVIRVGFSGTGYVGLHWAALPCMTRDGRDITVPLALLPSAWLDISAEAGLPNVGLGISMKPISLDELPIGTSLFLTSGKMLFFIRLHLTAFGGSVYIYASPFPIGGGTGSDTMLIEDNDDIEDEDIEDLDEINNESEVDNDIELSNRGVFRRRRRRRRCGVLCRAGKGLKKGGKRLAKGVKRAGKGLAKGVKKAGKGLAKGVKKAGKGIAKGVKGVGKGIGKVGKAIGKGMKRIGRALRKGWEKVKAAAKKVGKCFKDLKGCAGDILDAVKQCLSKPLECVKDMVEKLMKLALKIKIASWRGKADKKALACQETKDRWENPCANFIRPANDGFIQGEPMSDYFKIHNLIPKSYLCAQQMGIVQVRSDGSIPKDTRDGVKRLTEAAVKHKVKEMTVSGSNDIAVSTVSDMVSKYGYHSPLHQKVLGNADSSTCPFTPMKSVYFDTDYPKAASSCYCGKWQYKGAAGSQNTIGKYACSGCSYTNGVVDLDSNLNSLKDEIGEVILQYGPMIKNMKIFIDGHTDTVGESDYNQALAGRRLNAVRRWFEHNLNIENYCENGNCIIQRNNCGECEKPTDNLVKQEWRRVDIEVKFECKPPEPDLVTVNYHICSLDLKRLAFNIVVNVAKKYAKECLTTLFKEIKEKKGCPKGKNNKECSTNGTLSQKVLGMIVQKHLHVNVKMDGKVKHVMKKLVVVQNKN